MDRSEMYIDIMQDSSQKIRYDLEGIPYYVRSGFLSFYPQKRALCHWHEDFEIIQILHGSMNYFINGTQILLEEGDGVLINSAQMHYAFARKNQDCQFLCILFSPELLNNNLILYENYVKTFLTNPEFPFIYLDAKKQTDADLLHIISDIKQLNETESAFYELETVGKFQQLFTSLYTEKKVEPGDLSTVKNKNLILQKEMLSFIHQNYMEKITLSDIAASANVSSSTCCRLFKKYICQTPIEYTNLFRLKNSTRLLLTTDASVMEIGLQCGFEFPSYFAELFQKYYGVSPREYRKLHQKI